MIHDCIVPILSQFESFYQSNQSTLSICKHHLVPFRRALNVGDEKHHTQSILDILAPIINIWGYSLDGRKQSVLMRLQWRESEQVDIDEWYQSFIYSDEFALFNNIFRFLCTEASLCIFKLYHSLPALPHTLFLLQATLHSFSWSNISIHCEFFYSLITILNPLLPKPIISIKMSFSKLTAFAGMVATVAAHGYVSGIVAGGT